MYCQIDDKHVPLYRVMWISEIPHFCGHEDCEVEGRYEIRLEHGESVFGTREERDQMIATLRSWQMGADEEDEESWE